MGNQIRAKEWSGVLSTESVKILKMRLKQLRMNQLDLAELSHVPVRTLYKIFSSETNSPSLDTAIRICYVLGLTVEEVFSSNAQIRAELLLGRELAGRIKPLQKQAGERRTRNYRSCPYCGVALAPGEKCGCAKACLVDRVTSMTNEAAEGVFKMLEISENPIPQTPQKPKNTILRRCR